MARYFTIAQATALLPLVERHLQDALFARGEYRKAEEAFEAVRSAIQMAGGSVVNREKVTQIVAKKHASDAILQQEMHNLEALGVQVKDLDTGLIDFPTIYHGEVVLLCWRFGEERIGHWHGLTEGFRGRKVIDEEFLAAHSGDPEH
jgi:hypothetical protein